jgi:hypothetical protein
MELYVKILTAILALIFFIFFIKIVSSKSIKPFFSFLWFTISLTMFSVIVFEKFYKRIATYLGIHDATFLIVISVLFFLLIYVLYLSIKISEMSDRIQELISFTAILKKKVRDDT